MCGGGCQREDGERINTMEGGSGGGERGAEGGEIEGVSGRSAVELHVKG